MTTSADERATQGDPEGPAAGGYHDPPEPTGATSAFAELGRIDLAVNDLSAVLRKVVDLARASIPAAAAVSVTLVQDGVAGTAAHSGDVALALDERQYHEGYGPCLDAAAGEHVNVIADMSTDARWPAFAAAAVDHGVRASLSVGIPIRDQVTGGMNLYATEPDAFDEDAVRAAQTFAGYAATAVANAHLYETTSALAEQMAEAMRSRAVIEQAKGVLMAQRHVDADRAFDILSRASQVSNRKLRDIAQGIVDAAQRG